MYNTLKCIPLVFNVITTEKKIILIKSIYMQIAYFFSFISMDNNSIINKKKKKSRKEKKKKENIRDFV